MSIAPAGSLDLDEGGLFTRIARESSLMRVAQKEVHLPNLGRNPSGRENGERARSDEVKIAPRRRVSKP